MLFLLACSPVAVFAAEQPAADKQEADERDEAGEGEEELTSMFNLGMSKKEAAEKGAKATKDAGVMLYTTTWLDVEWKAVLMFASDELVTIALQTDINNKVLAYLLSAEDERNYKPLNATGADKREIAFYRLAAEGKSAEAREEAFQKALDAFADAESGKFVAIFCPEATLDRMAEVIKKKGDEDAAMKKEADIMIDVLQMDKKDDKMLLLTSRFGTMVK